MEALEFLASSGSRAEGLLSSEEPFECRHLQNTDRSTADYARYVTLSSASIHSLALVAPFDCAFSTAHKTGIFVLMLGIDFVQCMIMYYLHYVTYELLRSGAGCECNAMLQWLCIFCFLIIVWQEISQTVDSIEFLYSNHEDEFLAAMAMPSPLREGREGTPEVGRCPHWDDSPDDSPNEDSEWTCYDEGRCWQDHGWNIFSDSAGFRLRDKTMDDRQANGFRVGPMTRHWKISVSLATAVTKLLIESLLMYIGSMYIATSRDNEEVITSVVAVTFICTMDDQISTSFLPGKISDALHRTTISWKPETDVGWLWVRIRSDYRMFVDALVVFFLSIVMFHIAAFHAQCHITAAHLHLLPEGSLPPT